MKKRCSSCEKTKDITEFYKFKRSPDGHQHSCKDCMKLSYTTNRSKNKERYNAVRKKRQDENVIRYALWKDTQVCAHCGLDNPICLDLHHLDPNEKDDMISDMVRVCSWETLWVEIQKCIVLCSNCHRIEHHRLKWSE